MIAWLSMIEVTLYMLCVSDDVDTCYSKLLLATPRQVQEIIDVEMSVLQQQLIEEGKQVHPTLSSVWYKCS